MSKLEGAFTSARAADQAVNALIEAGVARNSIHKWNIIPEKSVTPDGESSAARGARTGLYLGGAVGAAVGGTLGAFADASKEEPSLPDPTGVRVVVDNPPGDVDVQGILKSHGGRDI